MNNAPYVCTLFPFSSLFLDSSNIGFNIFFSNETLIFFWTFLKNRPSYKLFILLLNSCYRGVIVLLHCGIWTNCYVLLGHPIQYEISWNSCYHGVIALLHSGIWTIIFRNLQLTTLRFLTEPKFWDKLESLIFFFFLLQLLFKILHCHYLVVYLWETLLVLSQVLLWLLKEFIYMDFQGLETWKSLPILWKWRCFLLIQMFVCQI